MRTILLASLLVGMSASAGGQTAANQQTDNQQAPSFTLKDIRGRHARLSDYKGKVLLINFWATWCAPCQAEMPALVELQKEYQARGLQIIGVTYPPERRSAVRRVMRRFKLNYAMLFGTRLMTDAYDIGEVLPVTIVVDRNGKIRERILGMLEPEDFKEKVAPLLEQTDVRK